MSESTLVECPVCETEFDPTAAGGWCTNSECGEWRHEGADLTRGDDDTTAESDDETGVGADDSEAESPAADEGPAADPTPAIQYVGGNDADDSGAESDEETTTASSTDEPVDGHGTAEESETADTESEATDAEPEPEDAAESADITCPNCAETVDADVSFCPSCGEDVSAVEPGDGDDKLTACPACETDVGPDASFCPSCGEDLDAHRDGEELTTCPTCGDDVAPEDSFCASCGEDLDAHRGSDDGEAADEAAEADPDAGAAASESEPAPESLVLQTRGEEITVEDGDTVGRELRRIVTETGGDEDDAVRIHREHVRFVREDDQFYLVDLGRNPTALNDTSLEQGDRQPVAPGDELRVSDVITLAVREP